MAEYRKNKDGYYRSYPVVGTRPDGSLIRKSVRAKTLTEFKEKLKAVDSLKSQNYNFREENTTLGEWADRWFNTYKKGHVGNSMETSYEIMIRLHIKPKIGGMKLCDVRQHDLQNFLNGFEGKSKSEAQKARITVHQIIKSAYMNGMIVKDVSDGVVLPSTTQTERRPLTENEYAAVIKLAETHRAGLWILTMLDAALRPEETVPLMWDDICLDDGNESITIKRAVEWINNKAQIKAPKKKEHKVGKEKERTIPIPSELSDRLRTAERRGPYVFPPAESDGMMSLTNMRRMWKSFRRELDISMGAKLHRNKIVEHALDQSITPYYFRHTCCTRWFEKGLDLKTVQYLMGHADFQTTANIYIHVMAKSVDKAGEIIRGKKSCAKNVPKDELIGE